MNYEEAVRRLNKYGQEHLLEYYDGLDGDCKARLLKDIEKADFSVVKCIGGNNKKTLGEISPISAVSVEEIKKRRKAFEALGIKMLEENKVAAVLLAGGQGTRLGFDGPKGTFNIGVTKELSIFEQQMKNIAEVTALSGRYFLLFIMTSEQNHDETVNFFKAHDYFGYPHDRIYFYVQDVAPTCDYQGKVFLSEKHLISFSPNGNGGWYSSLVNSGLGKILEREGIEWLNVYSVDNVLQRICDPVFIGATLFKNCRCGAKVVKKACAEEKVGVLCMEDGKPTIVEYYEMPEDLKNLSEKGELVYRYGVILNYLFSVKDLNKSLTDRLPYHLADKAITHMERGEKVTPSKPCGYKFETLVVDQVKLMGSCLAYEVEREREFAPVKNATGVDSVETARELLKKNNITI